VTIRNIEYIELYTSEWVSGLSYLADSMGFTPSRSPWAAA
jgi:hypothetical protein